MSGFVQSIQNFLVYFFIYNCIHKVCIRLYKILLLRSLQLEVFGAFKQVSMDRFGLAIIFSITYSNGLPWQIVVYLQKEILSEWRSFSHKC